MSLHVSLGLSHPHAMAQSTYTKSRHGHIEEFEADCQKAKRNP